MAQTATKGQALGTKVNQQVGLFSAQLFHPVACEDVRTSLPCLLASSVGGQGTSPLGSLR